MTDKKCGYIALIGAPNSGKSTLLNAALRKKISIVSNKPQTTRGRILGISTSENAQLLFLDTPGFVTSSRVAAGSSLKSIPWEVCQEADVICYLIDATRGWRKEDTNCLQNVLKGPRIESAGRTHLFVLGTKTDKIKKNDLRVITEEFQKNMNEFANQNASLLMLSAKKPENVKALLDTLAQNMPQSEWLYDKDSVTDCTENFICAEFIREQLFRQLGEELPYQTTVVIEKLEKKLEIVHIYATIAMERESQKAIVIGHGGSRLKAIGQLSRESLEKHLGKKVFLKIFVKKGAV